MNPILLITNTNTDDNYMGIDLINTLQDKDLILKYLSDLDEYLNFIESNKYFHYNKNKISESISKLDYDTSCLVNLVENYNQATSVAIIISIKLILQNRLNCL